jgi:hypothetical protein
VRNMNRDGVISTYAVSDSLPGDNIKIPPNAMTAGKPGLKYKNAETAPPKSNLSRKRPSGAARVLGFLSVLGPLVFTPNLFLLFRGEVVCYVEGLPNLLGRFSLNHVGDRLATHIEERLDVEVV